MAKYNVDFTTIPTEIVNEITKEVKKINCLPVFICKKNNHPESEEDFIVIGQYDKPHSIYGKAYCLWEATTWKDGVSLQYGHYGISFQTAMQKLSDKITDWNN